MKSWPQMALIEPAFAFAARGGPLAYAFAQRLTDQPARGMQFSIALNQLACRDSDRVLPGFLLIPPLACAFERRGNANFSTFVRRPLPRRTNTDQTII